MKPKINIKKTKANDFFFKIKRLIIPSKNPAIKKDSFLIQMIWVTPALFLLAVFMFYAIFIVARTAINGGSEVAFQFSLVNFKRVAANTDFQVALQNSLIYSLVVVPVSLFISLIVAKALTSVISKRIFSFLQGVFFLPFVTSALAIAMTFAFIFSSGGVLNQILSLFKVDPVPWLNDAKYSIWVLVIYGTWSALPFQIIMLTTALIKINNQYYQAASVDGMSRLKQFFKITIPLTVPMLTYLFTIGLINSFKVFPLGLYAEYSQAVTFRAQTVVFWIFQRRMDASYNEAAAASIILMAAILGITLATRFASRQLSKKYS